MKSQPIPQPSLEEIQENAKLFTNRADWRYKGYQYYKWAKKLGIRDQCCDHMTARCGRKNIWTEETVKENALKYTNRETWHNKNSGAYNTAVRLNILEICCAHMPHHNSEVTLDEIAKESKKFKHITDWRHQHPRTYNKACKLKIVAQFTSHMDSTRRDKGDWTELAVREEAKKYEYFSEWHKNAPGSYGAAKKFGIFEDCSSHMKIKQSCFVVDKGIIYGYFFSDNTAYIGQTVVEQQRIRHHMHKGPVCNKIKSGVPYEYKQIEINIPFKDILLREQYYMDMFRTEGWKLLNTKSAASRGTLATVYWSKNKILDDAKKFNTRTEWAKNSPGGYNACRKRNLMSEATLHMDNPIEYTKEKVMEIAKQYTTRTAWRKAHGGASNFASKYGFLEEACAHMDIIKKHWTKEEIIEEAKKYKHLSVWMNESRSSYDAASVHGVFDICSEHMEMIRKLWTDEDIKNDAKKFNKKTQWARQSGSAYNAARKRGILEECCVHMIPRINHRRVNKMKRDAEKALNIQNQ